MTVLLDPVPGIDLTRCIAGYGRPSGVAGVDKDTCDLARYTKIVQGTPAEVIIETGSGTGFSANWFADQGLDVITIDRHPQGNGAPEHPRVIRLTGNSVDPQIAARAAVLTDGRPTMVSLDADHSRRHVAAEIDLYADLVTVGCYLVVEDGIYHYLDEHPYDGDPLQAISERLPQRGDFVRDLDIEAMFPVTGAIAGWWGRV